MAESKGSQPGQKIVYDEQAKAEIRTLIEHFYQACDKDMELGPIFREHLRDWETHLNIIQEFWSSMIYKTGNYHGRPIEAHQQLPNLLPEHFNKWLALWEASVDECVSDENKETFKHWAGLMARSLSKKV